MRYIIDNTQDFFFQDVEIVNHLEEGKKLNNMIASYLKRITSAEAKKLENNEIFNKTNEVLDGMLKQKFSAENVSTTSTKERGSL